MPSLIPHTANTLDISPFELLVAVPIMFWGLFLGVLGAPSLGQRLGAKTPIRIAATGLAVGLAAVGAAQNTAAFLVGAFLVGLGFGVIEVTVTAQARIQGGDVSRSLMTLNAAFAIAAVISPILLALWLFTIGNSAIVYPVALLAAIAGWSYSGESLPARGSQQPLNLKLFVVFILACGLYVGAESILAGWAATIFSSSGLATAELAPIGTTVFWAMLALGRITSLFLTPRLISQRVALVFWPLASSAGLLLIFLSSDVLALAAAGFVLASFAAGPLYGFLIGVGLQPVAAEQSSRATRLLVLGGAAGGFFMPAVAQLVPGLGFASIVAAASMATVAVIGIASSRRAQPTSEVSI